MRLYLDDDSAGPRLAAWLRHDGHDVQLPVEVGMVGKPDSVHLTHAVRKMRVCLSRDHGDFENLQENNPRRNLTVGGTARAIANLLAAGVPIAGQYIILNYWR